MKMLKANHANPNGSSTIENCHRAQVFYQHLIILIADIKNKPIEKHYREKDNGKCET